MKFQLSLIALICSTCLNAQIPTNQELYRIDSLLNSIYEPEDPGGVVAVAKGGRIIYTRAFGLASLELQVPNKTESVIQIGSITKQFTATAILRLYEESKLNIHDEINEYFPEVSPYWDGISIEHLLSHTSGIIDLFEIPEWISAWSHEFEADELLTFFKDKELLSSPGTNHHYSNAGYGLLGLIIEQASGMSYPEYLKKIIFDPLDMKSTSIVDENSVVALHSNEYQATSDGFKRPMHINSSHYYAAGSILTSAGDMVKWNTGLLGGKIINDSLLRKATSVYILNDGKESSYGYGFDVGERFGGKIIEHGGSTVGSNCHDLCFLKDSLFIIVLNNSIAFMGSGVKEKYDSRNTSYLLASICYHKSILKPKHISLTDKEFEFYQGVYHDTKGKPRHIYSRAGKMYWTNSRGSRFEIFYLGNDRFGFESDNILTFVPEEGKIKEVILTIGDDEYRYNKTDLPLPEPKSPGEIPQELYDKILGKYTVAAVFKVRIEEGNNSIIVHVTGQEPSEFYLENDLTFFKGDEDQVTMEFTRKQGEIDGFYLNLVTNKMKGKKKK